jgi:hypothetical protein
VPPNFWTIQPLLLAFFNSARAISGLITDRGGLIDSEQRGEGVEASTLSRLSTSDLRHSLTGVDGTFYRRSFLTVEIKGRAVYVNFRRGKLS